MQSNGGIIRIEEARRNGVRCIFSGPAGGVIGAYYIASLAEAQQPNLEAGVDRSPRDVKVLTFDMGGTSTDVSSIDRQPQITTEATI